MSQPPFPLADGHHVAQVNIARLRAPLDSPQLAGFVALLEPVNAIADGSPGFVWRLQSDAGDATAYRPFDDDRIMINLSVWESLPALWDFVYVSRHLDAMRRRREWFDRVSDAYVTLWWLRPGQRPTIEDATARLALLEAEGPGARAFTFAEPFPPPAAAA